MKKFLFSLCTLLMLVGWHRAWADTFSIVTSAYSKETLSTALSAGISNGLVNVSFSNPGTDFQSNDEEAGDGVLIIKMRGSSKDKRDATITINTVYPSIVVQQVVLTYTGYNRTLTCEGSTHTEDTDAKTHTFSFSPGTSSLSIHNQDNNLYITQIDITYTDNRTELLTTDFKFNRGEEDYEGTSGRILVNSTAFNTGDADPFEFVYDATRTTLRVKLNVLEAMTASDFNVTSSDASVLDVSSISFRKPKEDRVYVEGIQVKGAGTANLTFTYNGSETYKAADRTVTFNVKAPNTTFAGNYKYTWAFNDNIWENTKLQSAYYTNSDEKSTSRKWTINDTKSEARNVGNIPADNGIEKIQGLAFTAVNDGLCLDWTYNCIWLDGSVTIPNLVKGQVITIVAATDATITVGGSTLTGSSGTFTYNVTDDAPSGITFTVNGKHIYSIAVSNAQYGWEYTTESATLEGTSRNIKGTFTFTEDGPIAGGTVIDEVPGITMTVGTSGTDYMVENHSQIGYAPGCIEYIFTPTVNGYLTVNMYSANSHTYIRENGNPFIDITASIYNGDYTTPNDKPLKAGNTYRLHVKTDATYNPIYLHSFTFRPAFLNPTTNTDQLAAGDFTARINDPLPSAFPKLIDRNNEAQQNRVKFAGEKTIVHLYKNNDVEIIGTGTNVLIRGTVLDKNNEDGLVAYYYLNSYVLNLVSSELDDQAYIDTDGLGEDKKYTFTFSGNIASAADASVSTVMVKVKTDAQNEVEVGANISGATLNINFGDLSSAEGSTYRITIPANVVALVGDATTKNSEIIRTFSVNKAGELQLKMVYPTDIATVGTTIVLETYVNGSTSGLTLNDGAKVKMTLSADGEEDMVIDAAFSGNMLSLKPTRTLKYNKDYTLTYTYDADNNVITSKPVSNTTYQVTHDKVFTFTTGSSSGTSPKVVASSPTENALVPGSAHSGGRISFTFDQTVDLEPYSEVRATPINGGESTAHANTNEPLSASNTLKIDDDGKTVYFDYSTDEIKYDLYYEVVIPANTVVGVGGLPNTQPITLHFRMGMNPNATPVNPATFYPHTWDFGRFGDKTNSATTAYNIINNYGEPGSDDTRINSLWSIASDGYTSYKTKNLLGYGFDQGNDVYFNDKNKVKHVLQEFEGVRISLVSSRSDRFELRNETSKTASYTNSDGTDKWEFRMIGNTHYLTLSNVPAGKLYMVVNGKHIGINSPNAVYESVSGSGYGMENENTLLNTNGSTRKVVIKVTEAGDVTFCVKDFSCEKIGVSAFSKKFKPNYVEGDKTYASDCQAYDVRYDLTNEFTDDALKAYYISGIENYEGENTAVASAVEAKNVIDGDNYNAIIKGGSGTILVYQSAAVSDKDIPLFKTDVNTAAPATVSNVLIGSTEDNTAVDSQNGYYNYVLSYGGSGAGGTEYGVGFYRYRGTTIGANKAYMQVPTSYVDPNGTAAAKSIRLVFEEDDDISGIVNVHDANTLNDGYYYNLNGVRVMNPAKGVYIKNGKKIVIK